MNHRKEIQEELKQIAPFLRALQGKGDGLAPPEGYFDRLDDQVWQQIKAGEKPRKIHPLRFILQFPYHAGIAATLALAVAVLFWVNKPRQSGDFDLSELTPQEAKSYILNHIEDFDLSLLVDMHPEPSAPADPEPADTLDSEWEQLLDEYLEEVDEAELEQIMF